MPNILDKEKPYPENRSPESGPTGPKRSRFSVWTIVAILIVLALLVWIFAFTLGEQHVPTSEQTSMIGTLSYQPGPAG